MSKIKLIRVLEIMQQTDEGNPLTANQICSKLKLLYSIEAEKKSVNRDINVLKDCGYDILQADDVKKGWYLAQRTFEDWEVKVLVDGVSQMKYLTKNKTKELIRKILETTSNASKNMLKKMPIITTVEKTESKHTQLTIDTLLKAIQTKRKVCFQYVYMNSNRQEEKARDGYRYQVSPFYIILRNGDYYLYGIHEEHADLSYYKIQRMRKVETLNEQSVEPEEVLGLNPDLRLQEIINSGTISLNVSTIHLVIECKKNMLDSIYEKFGSSIVVTENSNGLVNITIKVKDDQELYFWLLQYCKVVTVIEPQKVRDEMKKTLQLVLSKYK